MSGREKQRVGRWIGARRRAQAHTHRRAGAHAGTRTRRHAGAGACILVFIIIIIIIIIISVIVIIVIKTKEKKRGTGQCPIPPDLLASEKCVLAFLTHSADSVFLTGQRILKVCGWSFAYHAKAIPQAIASLHSEHIQR